MNLKGKVRALVDTTEKGKPRKGKWGLSTMDLWGTLFSLSEVWTALVGLAAFPKQEYLA